VPCIETTELPVVRAEFSLITSLFQNLLSNAIKFRGDMPPQIIISAERDDKFWRFSVADNGIGIEPEYADRIFVIFQRLHDRASYSGHRNRASHVPEDRRVLRWQDLAGNHG